MEIAKQKGADKDDGHFNAQTLFTVQTNPLLIDTVLHWLFRLADYESLKVCRIVCSKWKEIGDPLFVKRSAFVVSSNKRKLSETFLQNPVDISSLFKSINQEKQELRFQAFKFQDEIFTPAVRETYLQKNKSSMLQLEIRHNDIVDTGPILKDCNNGDHLIGPNLSKLVLSSRWHVSIGKLASISQLELFCVTFLVNSDNGKMAPKELKLVMCRLDYSGSHVRQMTEILDFQFLRKLYLYNSPRLTGAGAEPVLNLSDCTNIKELTLIFMTINLNAKIFPEELNLQDNKYLIDGNKVDGFLLNNYLSPNEEEIRTIKLDDKVTINLQSSIAIGELEIEGYTLLLTGPNSPANIKKLKQHSPKSIWPPENNPCISFDLSFLPKTLEYLEITPPFHFHAITCFNPLLFPNLKHLFLRKYSNHLPHFQKCPSLNYISLDEGFETGSAIDFDELPLNIKGLSLKDVSNVEFSGIKTWKLDVLVWGLNRQFMLDRVISTFELHIAKRFQVPLVLFHIYDILDSKLAFFHEEDITKILCVKNRLSISQVALGPVKWETEEAFQKSAVSSFVDRKSEYYLFQGPNNNGTPGTGITNKEFCKMIPFDSKVR